MGMISGVVNCAGSIHLKPAHLTSRKQLDEALQSNVVTASAAVRGAVNVLRDSPASIVLLSSAAARLGMPNHEAIGAAKGAVEGLVRSAAASYASRQIRVNAVAPGLVETKLSENLVSNTTSLRVSQSLHALGRIGQPEEVASAVCWLLDPEQSWVTGQVIGVDGGLSQVQPRPRLASAAW